MSFDENNELDSEAFQADELVLTEDLLGLAEQLQADAAFLATRYPALFTSHAKTESRTVSRTRSAAASNGWRAPLLLVGALAATLLVALALPRLVSRWNDDGISPHELAHGANAENHQIAHATHDERGRHGSFQAEQNSGQTQSHKSNVLTQTDVQDHNVQDRGVSEGQSRDVATLVGGGDDSDLIDQSSSPTQSTPVYFLKDVSGPELEGFLDLLETDKPQEMTLSI